MVETPELNRMKAIKDRSQSIGGFLDWLQNEKGIVLAKYYSRETDEDGNPIYRNFDHEIVDDWRPPHPFMSQEQQKELEERQEKEGIYGPMVEDGNGEVLHPYHFTIEKLLAEYFEIDLKKVEEEKRALLEELRSKNATPKQ